MLKLVLLRHGQSIWNLDNLFSGWTDVDLSEQGASEARSAGETLLKEGFTFDLVFTSVLKRAIRTLWIILETMDLMWIPIHGSWMLNEKHYGALQGRNKKDMAAKFGEQQVKAWRRGYAEAAPPLSRDDVLKQNADPRYCDLKETPATESLKDTERRVVAYWLESIVPFLQQGKKVIIVAHGNSLRALVKYLDRIDERKIEELNIPTGIPLVYEFNENVQPQHHYYLGDQEKIREAIGAVAGQLGKSSA